MKKEDPDIEIGLTKVEKLIIGGAIITILLSVIGVILGL